MNLKTPGNHFFSPSSQLKKVNSTLKPVDARKVDWNVQCDLAHVWITSFVVRTHVAALATVGVRIRKHTINYTTEDFRFHMQEGAKWLGFFYRDHLIMQEDFHFVMSYTVESDKSLILDSVTKYLSCTWSFPTCQCYQEFSLMLVPLHHCLIMVALCNFMPNFDGLYLRS